MRSTLLLMMLVLASLACKAQPAQDTGEAEIFHRAQEALTDVIIHDIFSPTGASRIYAYSNIAAYETLVKVNPGYFSLQGQLKGFPVIPGAKKRVNISLSAICAFFLTAKKLVS